MPLNNFSVGKDITFSVVTPPATLTLTGETDYSVKPMFSKLTHKGLNGISDHAVVPDGWQIDIRFERKDPTVDRYFAQYEADYYNGVNLKNGTILETIQEADGSISQFRYTNVSLELTSAGDWKGDAFIPISVTAMASRRIPV